MDIIDQLIVSEQEAIQFGFKWERATQILKQISNECMEVETHLLDGDKIKLQEEVGDLMHATFSLCLFLKLNPKETLEISFKKFNKRLGEVKKIAFSRNFTSLEGQPFHELMSIWDEAKSRVG